MSKPKALTARVDEARKALAGFLVPALLTLLAALHAGSDQGTSISTAEWIETLIAALLTSGAVYAVRNGRSRDSSTSTPDFSDGGQPTDYDLGDTAYGDSNDGVTEPTLRRRLSGEIK